MLRYECIECFCAGIADTLKCEGQEESKNDKELCCPVCGSDKLKFEYFINIDISDDDIEDYTDCYYY